ncbi:hypothetical protein ASZ90_010430 [hydrocarbon metagenome]|uniref:Uncharacterized protein n=1 Tax=hydrocarbon metagenome TaxID=938273 RepID=A0A0W8FG28_9ZZZZ
MDDHRCVPPELEPDPFASGDRFQVPADRRAAGKREVGDPWIGSESLCPGGRAGHHADRLGRDAGIKGHLAEKQGGERGLRGGAEDEGVSGGKRRTELVAGEVERKIERGDPEHDAEREAPDVPGIPLPCGRPVEREDLSARPLCLLCRYPDRLHGALDLRLCKRPGLPCFEDDCCGQLVASPADLSGKSGEDGSAAVSGERPGNGKPRRRTQNAILDIGIGGKADAADGCTVIGKAYVGALAAHPPFAADKKRTRFVHTGRWREKR